MGIELLVYPSLSEWNAKLRIKVNERLSEMLFKTNTPGSNRPNMYVIVHVSFSLHFSPDVKFRNTQQLPSMLYSTLFEIEKHVFHYEKMCTPYGAVEFLLYRAPPLFVLSREKDQMLTEATTNHMTWAEPSGRKLRIHPWSRKIRQTIRKPIVSKCFT